jgi:hypothetical protein
MHHDKKNQVRSDQENKETGYQTHIQKLSFNKLINKSTKLEGCHHAELHSFVSLPAASCWFLAWIT